MSLVLRKIALIITIASVLLLFSESKTSFLVQAQTPSITPTETPTPTPTSTPAPDNSKATELQEQINELQGKITELQGQEKTLSSQIAVMDNQMRLTQLRINSTKQQIKDLTEDIETTTKKIGSLEESLTIITKVLINRVITTYEVGSIQPFHVLLSSEGVSNFLQRLNYLKIAQAHDKKVIYETQQAKVDYANEKEIFEGKKAKVETLKKELEGYTSELDREKVVKEQFLEQTRNNERRYQDLLAKARAEFEAIQGIISGKGNETEIKNVSEGDRIASVISGTSCNSGGTHLHFIVSRNGSTENPFNYLKPVDYENCSGSSCGSGDGDPFNPAGTWNWPVDPKIKLSQGYGSTWATKYTWVSQIYSFHNGIDIDGSSADVKAVKGGVLYQGSYTGYNGCRLRYTRVRHEDLGLDTLYLHINYLF